MQELERRISERQAEHDALDDKIRVAKHELRRLDEHCEELRASIRKIYGIDKPQPPGPAFHT